jgi:hypothetical protein
MIFLRWGLLALYISGHSGAAVLVAVWVFGFRFGRSPDLMCRYTKHVTGQYHQRQLIRPSSRGHRPIEAHLTSSGSSNPTKVLIIISMVRCKGGRTRLYHFFILQHLHVRLHHYVARGDHILDFQALGLSSQVKGVYLLQ